MSALCVGVCLLVVLYVSCGCLVSDLRFEDHSFVPDMQHEGLMQSAIHLPTTEGPSGSSGDQACTVGPAAQSFPTDRHT